MTVGTVDSGAVENTDNVSVSEGATDSSVEDSRPNETMLSQAEVDSVIEKRLARERARHARELDELKANLGKNEMELLQARAEKAEAQATEFASSMNQALTRAAAVEAAYGLDARPEKIDAIMRLADLPAPTEDGIDTSAVKASVEAVIADNPEWVRSKATGKPVGAGDMSTSYEVTEPKSIDEAVRKHFGF